MRLILYFIFTLENPTKCPYAKSKTRLTEHISKEELLTVRSRFAKHRDFGSVHCTTQKLGIRTVGSTPSKFMLAIVKVIIFSPYAIPKHKLGDDFELHSTSQKRPKQTAYAWSDHIAFFCVAIWSAHERCQWIPLIVCILHNSAF